MRLSPNLSPGDTSWIYSIPTLWAFNPVGFIPFQVKGIQFFQENAVGSDVKA